MANIFTKTFLTLSFLGIQIASAGGSSTAGIGNPAALNCEKLGGTLESYTTPEGQNANCVIEEWLLFREMDKRGLVHNDIPEEISMPNPASVNCIKIGGSIRVVQNPVGDTGYCVIEQWTLFRAIDITHVFRY
jgi:hypothetical protein